jgi:polyisoprenoid-binding protein YceI
MTLVAAAAAGSLALSGTALIVALQRPDHSRVAELRSQQDVEGTRNDQVRRRFRRLYQAHPRDAMYIYLWSRCVDDAAAQLALAEQGIRVDPKFSWNYEVAARALARLGRIAEAYDRAATGAALDPGNEELAEQQESLKRTLDRELLGRGAADDNRAPPPPPLPTASAEQEAASPAAGFVLPAMSPAATTFKVTGPAGLAIEGRISEMSVVDDGVTVTITVPLVNLDTSIGLRNEHTKKALDVGAYPTTSLRVTRGALTFPAARAESSGDAKGSLTLHGQTRDVTFHYSARVSGDRYEVKGSTRINMDDYGVKRPSYLGVTVKPDVDVTTAFQL